MYGLLLAWLRERGFRIVTQVDDGRLLCRHGPTMSYAQLLLVIGIHHYFRLRIHLRRNKATTLWPHSQGLFDGVILDLRTITVYSNPTQEERHRADLLQLHQRCINPQVAQPTLREYISITNAQRSHQAFWPTNLLVQRMSEFLGRVQSTYLSRGFTATSVWDQPIPTVPPSVLEAHRALLKVKTVGDFFYTTGPPVLEIVADTSTTGVGGQITHHQLQKRFVSQHFLTPTQRNKDHTPQEAEGLAEMTLAALTHLQVTVPPNQLRPITIGSDNVAAGININKPKTKSSMVDPVLPIWLTAMNRRLRPVYHRVDKHTMDHQTLCDWMGRWQPRHHPQEWGLQPHLVQAATAAILGQGLVWHRDLDLFACRNTRQTEAYFSRWMDHCAVGTDAMLQSWEWDGLLYAFPPEILLPRVVSRTWEQGLTLVLVLPLTEHKATHWADLRYMIRRVAILPHHPNNYIVPDGTQLTTDDPTHRCPLAICLLSPRHWNGKVTPTLWRQPRPYSTTTPRAELALIARTEGRGESLRPSRRDIDLINSCLGTNF